VPPPPRRRSPSDPLRVVFHIGPHKTGTTYMQRRFFQLRTRLARHGITYHMPNQAHLPLHEPTRVAGPGTMQHSDIATRLTPALAGAVADEVAAIRASTQACLLISSEALAKPSAEQLAPLKEIFAKDQVEVYAYCRRWSDRLPSHWWQLVSSGLTTPFPEWLAATLKQGTRNRIVNESVLWQRWADLFGRDAVHILSYDALRAARVDIADDFLHTRLRWPGKYIVPPQRRDMRTMPSPLEMEVIRALSLYAASHSAAITPKMRSDTLDRLRAADFQPFRDIVGENLETLPIDDMDPVFDESRQAMKAWEDRLATTALSPNILLPRISNFRFVAPEALQQPAAQAAFGDLLVPA